MPGLRRHLSFIPQLLALLAACADPSGAPTALSRDGSASAKPASGPVVSSTSPNESIRDTTLNVRVLGSGFDAGSRADFLLAGAADPKVRTNSTTFVSSGELIANITIDADAVPAFRDVAVTTGGGKKGIGTERFIVLEPEVVATPGNGDAYGWDVNSSGLVVGYYAVTDSGSTCTLRAFAWSESTGTLVLPLPAGQCQARAYKVNEAGTIIGESFPFGGALGTTGVVTRWTQVAPGTWTVELLPKPSAGLTLLTVAGIDEVGSTMARWNDGSGNPAATWVWRDLVGWTPLALPAGVASCPPWLNGMNANDEIVSFACGTAHHWSSPSATPVPLPLPSGATGSAAYAINDLGVIVGEYRTTSRGKAVYHVARWRPNGAGGWFVDDLGLNPYAKDVNDEGMIVGTTYAWTAGGGFDTLDPLSRTEPALVQAVSDRGAGGIAWIVGYGRSRNSGPQRVLIWRR